MAAKVKREAGRAWLDGLEPHASCENTTVLRHHCMNFLGLASSPAWIVGGMGGAFEMNVYRESLCESGPTRQGGGGWDLLGNVGCKLRHDWAPANQFDEFRPRIYKEVCKAIDSGYPAIGWDLAENIICGYDEDGNYLYFGPDAKVHTLHHMEMGDPRMGYAAIEIIETCEPADDRKTVREVLLFALENSTGKHREDPETCSSGIAGYDAWIAALHDPSKTHYGRCAFYADHYGNARKMAHAFLNEAKQRLAAPKLDPLLDEAIAHYRVVAENLGTVIEVFPLVEEKTDPVEDGPELRKAIGAVTTARDAEGRGLRALAKLALALGAEGIDPAQAGLPHP